jgi:hypothetical protein
MCGPRRQAFEDGHEFLRQVGVEVGRRLVGDEHLGIVDQRAADGHALLLAAGEPFDLGRAAVAELEPASSSSARSSSSLRGRPVG